MPQLDRKVIYGRLTRRTSQRFHLKNRPSIQVGLAVCFVALAVGFSACGSNTSRACLPSGAGGSAGKGAAGASGGSAGSIGSGGAAGSAAGASGTAGAAGGASGSAGGAAGSRTSVDGGSSDAACGGDPTCLAVAGSLSGLLWQLPCTAAGSPACATTSNTTVATTLKGALGTTYDVNLRFRGVVEKKTYAGGCSDGAYWLSGGADSGDTFNVYELNISSPLQTYFLNVGSSGINNCFAIDYEKTVRIDAGATVSLFANSVDNQEIINVGADGTTPLTVPGVSVAQPYNGQFIQMDVLSVNADPVASSATVGAGSAGNALSFNGAQGQYLTVANASSLQPANATVEGWFQFGFLPPSFSSGNYAMILGKPYQTGSVDSYALWYQGGAINAGVNLGSTSGAAETAWSPTESAWHHAAMTYDATAMRTTLYVDGLPVSCQTMTAPVGYDTHAVMIGADNDNGTLGGFWYGSMDEVRLFSTARTSDQIWADMHTHALGPTTGLVGEWTFDEGTGQTTADHSGTGNTATLGATSAAEGSDPSWVLSTVPH